MSNNKDDAWEGSVKKKGNLPYVVLTFKKKKSIDGAKIFNNADIKNIIPIKKRINLNSFLKLESVKYENLEPIILPRAIEDIAGTKYK